MKHLLYKSFNLIIASLSKKGIKPGISTSHVLIVLVSVISVILYMRIPTVTGDNNTIDNTVTISHDIITDDAVKINDIGNVQGDVNIGK